MATGVALVAGCAGDLVILSQDDGVHSGLALSWRKISSPWREMISASPGWHRECRLVALAVSGTDLYVGGVHHNRWGVMRHEYHPDIRIEAV